MSLRVALLVWLLAAGVVAQEMPVRPDGTLIDMTSLELADDVGVLRPEEPVLLGSWFELIVHGPLDTDASVRLVVLDAAGHAVDADAFHVESRELRSVEPDRVVLTRRVCAMRAGEWRLGGVLTDGERERALPVMALEVQRGLDPDRTPRVAELLDGVEPPLPAAPTGLFAAVLLPALAALGLLIVRHTRERQVVIHQPPADLTAIEALERLGTNLPRTADEIMVFVVQVGDVLRRYIEARFELHAPARTTEEFLEEVARRDDEALRSPALREFLQAGDLVKFARARPGEDELRGMLATALRFVEETRA